MSAFTDNTGATWQLSLTVGHLPQLREVGLDLSRVVREKNLAAVVDLEFEVQVRVLYVLCEQQAEKAGVKPEQFGYRFDGPTLEASNDALTEAVVDFFFRQEPAAKMKGQLKSYRSRVDQAAIRKMTAMEPLIMERIEKSILNGSAGSSPESSPSTPDP